MMSEGKKTGKIIAAIVAVILVVILGVTVLWIFKLSGPAPEGTPEQKQVGPIYETEEFTVNLSGSVNHYVKARFALETDHKKTLEELEEKLPLLQDAIIMVLSGQTFEILGTVQGKEDLKDVLIEALNSFLDNGTVTKVYYKTFIIS